MTEIKIKSVQWLFTGILALAIIFAAPAARAQSNSVSIGVLTPGTNYESVLAGLREGLAKFGYSDGENLTITVQDTQGETANLEGRVAKLIEAKPDLIFTVGTALAAAVKQATAKIPIVFSLVGDPVQARLVASFASSGNNLTGVSNQSPLLTAKRIELLKDLSPRAKSVLVIAPINETSAKVGLSHLDEPAKKMGFRLVRRDVSGAEELAKLLEEPWSSVDAVFPMPSILVGKNIHTLTAKTIRERLPLIVHEESWVQGGALASYGSDFRAMGAQAAKLAVKVLKGIKPADIPIETPDRLVLTINRSTAKAIGLKLPNKIMERAERIFD